MRSRIPRLTLGSFAALLLAGCATAPAPTAPTPVADAHVHATEPPMAQSQALPHVGHVHAEPVAPAGGVDPGIRFESLRLSGGGLLVDFRYRVLDPEKAARVVNRSARPYIVDPVSGMQFQVPHAQKVGTLRHQGGKLIADRVYSVLFANPGRTVKAGGKVHLVMGEYRLDNVTVE